MLKRFDFGFEFADIFVIEYNPLLTMPVDKLTLDNPFSNH